MSEDTKNNIVKTDTPVPVAIPDLKVAKNAAKADTYEHGFKVPLEIHPQHQKSTKIGFYIGNTQYVLSPKDILNLGLGGKINPGVSVGKLKWSVAIGLFVNNLDGGRNKALNDMLEQKKQDTISDNLK